MKTQKYLGINRTGNQVVRRTWPHSVAAILIGVTAFACAASARGEACGATSRVLFKACQSAAKSDYLVAIGKCDNLSDPTQQTQCRADATAALSDAEQTCSEQLDARQAVCAKLGGGPYDPVIDPANFVARVTNPYYPLPPGRIWTYEGNSASGFVRNLVIVTDKTKTILGVKCVEVQDLVYIDGALAEDTVDWLAQDKEGNVWYFGENTGELEDGRFVTLEGTFTAGENGDKAGIIMKAHPAVGDFYRQEFSLANAEDLAEVIETNATVQVPAGTFQHCVVTQETTPLETSLLENKSYAPGVGPILTVDLNTGEELPLVSVTNSPR